MSKVIHVKPLERSIKRSRKKPVLVNDDVKVLPTDFASYIERKQRLFKFHENLNEAVAMAEMYQDFIKKNPI